MRGLGFGFKVYGYGTNACGPHVGDETINGQGNHQVLNFGHTPNGEGLSCCYQ